MFEGYRKNIPQGELDLTLVSLISSNIKVGIVGGGRAAFIKATTFKESNLEILSEDFSEEFKQFSNCRMIKSEYKTSFIEDKHLIIIATNDTQLNNRIQKECNQYNKLFLNCENPDNGNVKIPAQRKGEGFIVGVNFKRGNPKGAIKAVKIAKDSINELEEYFKLTTLLRNKIKYMTYEKDDLLNFIYDDDFIYFFKKGKERVVLKLFYEEILIEHLYKN
ncbi:MAG: NAD(P)-dependent oxidoreductase [Clostridium sp.]